MVKDTVRLTETITHALTDALNSQMNHVNLVLVILLTLRPNVEQLGQQ